MNQRIAIIGAGPVGRAVAHGSAAAGHDVSIGVRRPDDPKHDDVRSTVSVTTIPDAVADAAIVVLAVPADSLEHVVPTLDLTPGQVLVDATNAVFTPVPDGFDTLGAFVASLLPPDVAYVKAFNTVGAEHLSGGAADHPTFLPIAGDAAGTEAIAALAGQFGFDVADLGGRDAVGMVEDHARLWIHLAFTRGWGRDFAWSVIRR